MVFFTIGNNSTSFFYLETIIASHGVLLVISMKESEPCFFLLLNLKEQQKSRTDRHLPFLNISSSSRVITV